jgi:hypothetical protein
LAAASLAVLSLFAVDAGGQTAGSPPKPGVESATPQEGQPAGRPALRAGQLVGSAVTLDGVLNDPIWTDVEAISNLITIEPQEGGVPVGKTTIKVLANPTEIVIGAHCQDPDPSGIVSFSKARDTELDDEDHVLFVIDTFLDGRSGYVFAVNPTGTRFDGLVSDQGTDVNSNWDGLWEARTSQDATGWSLEIRIPIKTLGFKRGLTTWGLNVERRIQRLQESSRWSGATQDYEIFQTSQAGLLTDLPAFDLGIGLSIRPAINAGVQRVSADAKSDFTGDPSLDITQKLGANLLGSVTVNTDFAETEIDARQTNLSRFELFFPEKRTFFLEGSDIFEFGLRLNEDGPLIPFFSRRIGLGEEGEEIPINAGGKVNGRVGNTNVGALVVNTRDYDAEVGGAATMGAVRVKQNIFAESSVGMIATFGDQLGRTGSWMTGADFTYQTSTFREDKNLFVSGWAMVNDRDDLTGNKRALGFGVDYPNDLVNLRLTTARIGEGFDPSLGFVPRNGVHVWDANAAYEPRPEWSLVRQMHHGVTMLLVNDLDQRWESYTLDFKPFDWLFESGDRIAFSYIREGDRPEEEFDVFESQEELVEVPAGSYEWKRYEVTGTLAEKRKVAGEITFGTGTFYGGDLDSIEGTLSLNHSLFKLEAGIERNHGVLPEGEFTQHLFSGRLELKFSPDVQFASFVQYDNESESFGSNTRLRWTFHPQGDLFVVYNHNLLRSLDELRGRRWTFDSNALIVKLQYAWRP